jgi:tRNA U55 pseudouridine synthase TruB
MFISRKEKLTMNHRLIHNDKTISEMFDLMKTLNTRIHILEKMVNSEKSSGWTSAQRLAQSKRMIKFWADRKDKK